MSKSEQNVTLHHASRILKCSCLSCASKEPPANPTWRHVQKTEADILNAMGPQCVQEAACAVLCNLGIALCCAFEYFPVLTGSASIIRAASMFARKWETGAEASTLSAKDPAEAATDYLVSTVHAPSRGHSASLPHRAPLRWAHLRTARGLPEMSLPVLRLNSCAHGTWQRVSGLFR